MMIIIRSSYTIPDDDDNHDDEREVFIVFVYFCAIVCFQRKLQREISGRLRIPNDLSETAL